MFSLMLNILYEYVRQTLWIDRVFLFQTVSFDAFIDHDWLFLFLDPD